MMDVTEFVGKVKRSNPIIEGIRALRDGTVAHREGFTDDDFTLALLCFMVSDGKLDGARLTMDSLGEYAGAVMALAAHLEKQRTG